MDSFGQRDNNDRADAAAKALEAYTATNTPQYADENPQTRIADLICDLLHLARRDWVNEPLREPDPLALLGTARSNFEEEEDEESGGEEGTFEAEEPHEDTPSLEDRGLTLGSYES